VLTYYVHLVRIKEMIDSKRYQVVSLYMSQRRMEEWRNS